MSSRAALACVVFAVMISAGCKKKAETELPGDAGDTTGTPAASGANAAASAAPPAFAAPPVSTLDQAAGNPAAMPSAAPIKQSPAFAKAVEASKEGRSAEVRRLLEAKVRSGHASGDEVRLVREACKNPYDKVCIDDIKSKYP